MTDKTISLYWFFVLFLIASAVVFLVYSLYGKPLDVRQMECVFLAEKVADCVSQGGNIPETILNKGGVFVINSENLLKNCYINRGTENVYGWNNDQLFVSIGFSRFENEIPILGPTFFVGNEHLWDKNSNMNSIDPAKNKNFPVCIERKIYSKGEDGKYYLITISTCVGKKEKNV